MYPENFVPAKFYLPGWPTDIIAYSDALDLVGLRDFYAPTLQPNNVFAKGIVQILGEIAFDLPLLPGLSIVILPGDDPNLTEIPFSFLFEAGRFDLNLTGLGAALRIQSNLLQRVERVDGSYEPLLDPQTQMPVPLDITLTGGNLLFNSDGEFAFTVADGSAPTFAIESFMIGDTGLVLADIEMSVILSEAAAIDVAVDYPALDQASRGVLIKSATLHFPEDLQVGILPDDIILENAFIGTGGFSGKISGGWDVVETDASNNHTLRSGVNGVGTIFEFNFGIESLAIEFVQNSIVASTIAGYIELPFFDELLKVFISIAGNGNMQVTLAADDPAAGLVEVTREGLFTLALNGLTIGKAGTIGYLILDGSITPQFSKDDDTADDEPPVWGTYAINGLTLDTNGNVLIDGGWLTLPEASTLKFYGFQVEIAQFGLGKTDDGRSWIGFSGGIQLVDGLPLGGSVEGLRIIWDPQGNVDFELAGIGINFEIRDTLLFEGEVAFIRDEATGLKGFRGGVRVQLTALNMWVDGQIVIMKQTIGSQKITGVYLFLELGLPVGIPIFQTGQAIFAIAGLFSYNILPGKTDQQSWYDWYAQAPLGVTDNSKWNQLQPGSFAFGAGLAVGTLPDGFPFSAEMLLVILIPGPVLLLQGNANIMARRTELGAGAGLFSALAVLDVPAGTFLFNVDVSYVKPSKGDKRGFILDMGVGAEAYFEFGDMSAWHLYLGEQPREKRIRADILNLFRADAYFMLEPSQVAFGASVGYDNDWKFGPVKIRLFATIGGDALVSWKPTLMWGMMYLEGSVEVRACGVNISLYAGADVEVKTPSPYFIGASVYVKVKLPWPVKDFEKTIRLEWQEPEVPPLPLPLESIAVEHMKVSDKWALAVSPRYDREDNPGYYISAQTVNQGSVPIVPVDGRIFINFAKPVIDVGPVGHNRTIPSSESVNDGEYLFDYYLDSVTVFKKAGGQYVEVDSQVVANWQWKNDGDPQNLCLELYGRTPFDYTSGMITQQGYIQGLLSAGDQYPCDYATEPRVRCFTFEQYSVDPMWERPILWNDYGFVINTHFLTPVMYYEAELADTTRAINAYGPKFPLDIYPPEPLARIDLYIKQLGQKDLFPLSVHFDDGSISTIMVARLVDQHGETREQIITLAEEGKSIVRIHHPAGEGDEFLLFQICYVTEVDAAVARGYSEQIEQMGQGISDVWSGEGNLFAPHTEYKVAVTTRTVRTRANGNQTEESFVQTALFQTGGPPGTNGAAENSLPGPGAADSPGQLYPTSGQLVDLAPYIQQTIPTMGGHFHYRSYDVGLLFNEPYVEQMYLMSGAPLKIALFDSNGRPVIDGNGDPVEFLNQWGNNPTTSLDVVETAYQLWFSAQPCLDLTSIQLPPLPELIGISDVPLEPLTMYEARLMSGSHTVYRLVFNTSRYLSMVDHVQSHTGELWEHPVAVNNVTLGAIADEITQWADPVLLDGGMVYARISEQLALGFQKLPTRVELTTIKDKTKHLGFLLESPEPLDFDRLELTLKKMNKKRQFIEQNIIAVANADQTRLLVFSKQKTQLLRDWIPGEYQLHFQYAGDAESQLPVLKQGGAVVDETVKMAWTVE